MFLDYECSKKFIFSLNKFFISFIETTITSLKMLKTLNSHVVSGSSS